jgi:hypothetical protein
MPSAGYSRNRDAYERLKKPLIRLGAVGESCSRSRLLVQAVGPSRNDRCCESAVAW